MTRLAGDRRPHTLITAALGALPDDMPSPLIAGALFAVRTRPMDRDSAAAAAAAAAAGGAGSAGSAAGRSRRRGTALCLRLIVAGVSQLVSDGQ